MHFANLLPFLLSVASCSLLVDFDASAGDDPSVIGLLNLEPSRTTTQKANSADLYIKLGTDPSGVAAAHVHRVEGDIRAEYHALNKKGEADTTYYIGYSFSLAELEQSLMIWQFKEYEANNAADGGANIPLALEVVNGKLQFQYQANSTVGRVAQWTKSISANTRYSVAIVINTSTPGWVELYFDGKTQGLGTDSVKQLPATTFPGRAEPKFGAYRGEAVEIDTYIYRVQIGTTLDDIKEAGGF